MLAANPMLAGRFWLLDDGRAEGPRAHRLRLRFADGGELRYVDREMLGKLYLVAPDGLDAIPGWTEMGPDADDPELTLEVFRAADPPPSRRAEVVAAQLDVRGRHRQRLQRRDPVGGQLAPLRRRSTLESGGDRPPLRRDALRAGRRDERLRVLVPPDIQRAAPGVPQGAPRGGEPCPRCGRELRQIGGDEATTFCRTCQPPF